MNIIIDAREAFRKIGALQREVGGKRREYLAVMQQALVAWVARNFQAEGLEEPWPPMSPNTRASRRKGGGGAKLLQDTGTLRASFAPSSTSSGSTIDESAMEVTVGTRIEYAKFHEFGTDPYVITPKAGPVLRFQTAEGWRSAKKVNHPGLPRRPMLPKPETAKRIALATLQAAIKRRIEQALKGAG